MRLSLLRKLLNYFLKSEQGATPEHIYSGPGKRKLAEFCPKRHRRKGTLLPVRKKVSHCLPRASTDRRTMMNPIQIPMTAAILIRHRQEASMTITGLINKRIGILRVTSTCRNLFLEHITCYFS